jgi:S-DNA-T family DNA segregation ATPase FtsK/SpoIIIE
MQAWEPPLSPKLDSSQNFVNSTAVTRLKEGLLLLLLAVSTFLFIAFVSFHLSDPGWSHTSNARHVANVTGWFGAWWADLFLSMFGYMAYFFPFMLVLAAWLGLRNEFQLLKIDYLFLSIKVTGFIMVFMAGCGLVHLYFHATHYLLPLTAGGLLGDVIGGYCKQVFGLAGATLFLSSLMLCGITLFSGLSWFEVLKFIGKGVVVVSSFFKRFLIQQYQALKEKRASRALEKASVKVSAEKIPFAPVIMPTVSERIKETDVDIGQDSLRVNIPPCAAPQKKKESQKKVPKKAGHFISTEELPSLELLNAPSLVQEAQYSTADLETLSRELEQRLNDFGIQAKVVAVQPGPVVTRFEIDLAPGVKVSRITSLAKDLSRSLSVISVRIVEVIPGKSFVGIELPNKSREIVNLQEVLASTQYAKAKSVVSLALGKDIAGHPVVVDLGKMPHLLVAGTTGSGKSVGLNAMILSILYKSSPKEVKVIMVDPKMLELSIYDGIPHLLTPVVTDMNQASTALRWCVAEMDRRYRLMASLGVRNLEGYNNKVKQAIDAKKPLPAPEWYCKLVGDPDCCLETLPTIVVIVDEFADMIMVVGKKVEQLISRIAQKARAAGIHLILATQRPSVNVITGLIKANIPTRIAFQVSSRIDSRTIIDQQGAEQLLGHGDMLYLPPGSGLPIRVHGAYVDDEEVHRVVEKLKELGEPEYIESILEEATSGESGESADGNGEKDALYDEAVTIVLKTRRASISSLQRRFRIGYNRAATLVDSMEQAGVVGPMESNGTREILVPERGGE